MPRIRRAGASATSESAARRSASSPCWCVVQIAELLNTFLNREGVRTLRRRLKNSRILPFKEQLARQDAWFKVVYCAQTALSKF